MLQQEEQRSCAQQYVGSIAQQISVPAGVGSIAQQFSVPASINASSGTLTYNLALNVTRSGFYKIMLSCEGQQVATLAPVQSPIVLNVLPGRPLAAYSHVAVPGAQGS
jgi:hypothetical protein